MGRALSSSCAARSDRHTDGVGLRNSPLDLYGSSVLDFRTNVGAWCLAAGASNSKEHDEDDDVVSESSNETFRAVMLLRRCVT